MILFSLKLIQFKNGIEFLNLDLFLLTCYPIALKSGPIVFPMKYSLIYLLQVLSDASLILLVFFKYKIKFSS